MDHMQIGLDHMKESQAVASSTSLTDRRDTKTDIAGARSEQRLALFCLSSKINQLITVQPQGTAMAQGDLTAMDARLKLLESWLAGSVIPTKMGAEAAMTRLPDGKAKVQRLLVRLVKPGILYYEAAGRVISELEPYRRPKGDGTRLPNPTRSYTPGARLTTTPLAYTSRSRPSASSAQSQHNQAVWSRSAGKFDVALGVLQLTSRV